MKGSCSGGHGSGHPCTKKKANPASLAIQQMEGTEEGTNLSHTAFNSVQINLAFLRPLTICSVLDKQLAGNGKSVCSTTDEKPSKAFSGVAQHIEAFFQIRKTSNLKYFLLASHWNLEGWIPILFFTHYINTFYAFTQLSHILMQVGFFLGRYTISYSYSLVNSLLAKAAFVPFMFFAKWMVPVRKKVMSQPLLPVGC